MVLVGEDTRGYSILGPRNLHRVVVNDGTRGTLNVQHRARNQVPARGDEEERLAHCRQPLRGADRAVVVKLEAARNRTPKSHVSGEPLAAPRSRTPTHTFRRT